MHNIQDLRNGTARIAWLTASIQQTATRGQIAADMLLRWLLSDGQHKDALFTEEELQQISAAAALLSLSEERMKTMVMPDLEEKIQNL